MSKAAPQPEGGQPQLVHLPVGKITPSPTNPRKFFDQAKLDELADSVRGQGVLEPVLVRAVKGGRYELIAGERRWRAATQAQLKEVPAIVREMSDEQVLDAQIHENLHRADVHPMDEAFGYQHLLKVVEGLTVEELSRRVGKSPSYVAQRLSLTSLIEPAVKDFMDGLITLGHAAQIARLAPESQPQALNACYHQEWKGFDQKAGQHKYVANKKVLEPVRDLVAWVKENLTLNLAKAPWSLEDAELLPEQGPCSTCRFNTATNLHLFGDAAQTATCTNPEGYKRKMQKWIERQAQKLRDEGAAQVLWLTDLSHVSQPQTAKRWSLPEGALGTDSFHLVEKVKDRCENTLPGVFVQGNRKGQIAWACTDPKCKDHKGRKHTSSSGGGAAGGQRVEKTPAEQKKMRERKQELFDARVAEPVRLRTLRALLDKINPATYADNPDQVVWPLDRNYFARMAVAHFERIPTDTQFVMYDVLGWQDVKQAKGDEWRLGRMRQDRAVERMGALDDVSLVRFMFLCSVAHLGENLGIIGGRRDQSPVTMLAAGHDVHYQLLDARERLNQSPAKKYHGAHSRYLLQVLLGLDDKRPKIFTDESTWNVSSAASDLERQVREMITPTPFLDGPEGVNLPGARVRFVGECEHTGKVGELLGTGNTSGGLLSKVRLDDGAEVEAHISTLVYVEGVHAELKKRQPPAPAPKAEASAPAKKKAAKAAAKKVGKKAAAKAKRSK